MEAEGFFGVCQQLICHSFFVVVIFFFKMAVEHKPVQLNDHILNSQLVKNTPHPSVCYLPNFISEEEEVDLLERIEQSPKPKWECLSNRRLQNWGGIIGKKGSLIPEEIPSWLQYYVDKVSGAFPSSNAPNHVLINEYEPGQGIMPHTDGPAFYPAVTTISVGSHTFLDFYRPLDKDSDENLKEDKTSLAERYAGSMFLERRSLIVIRNEMYSTMLHGIANNTQDKLSLLPVLPFNWFDDAGDKARVTSADVLPRGKRVSLTIRNVEKVAKNSVLSLLVKK